MSQIFGFISSHQSQADIRGIASTMKENMAFLKVDLAGHYLEEDVFICQNLVFNTPESFHTPKITKSEDDRFILFASCRIDNREDLSSMLSLENSLTTSDHIFILSAYLKYGKDCTHYLLGDFAFVVLDTVNRSVFMARDQMGVKTLFYTQTNIGLFFSNDLNAFKNLDDLVLKPYKPYIANLLSARTIPPYYTYFENVHRLLPSYNLYYDRKMVTTHQYYKLHPKYYPDLHTPEDYYAKFLQLFSEAVRCRLRSAFPIGAELSGGLDSSAIVCLAESFLQKKGMHIETFSFVFPKEARKYHSNFNEEESYQEIVIEHIHLPRRLVHKIDHWMFGNAIEEFDYSFAVNANSFTDTDFVWQEPILRTMFSTGTRVKLSGFPGDELITENGSLWYFDLIASGNIRNIFSFINKAPYQNVKKILYYIKTQMYDTRYKHWKKAIQQKNYLHPSYRGPFISVDDLKENVRTYHNIIISKICRPHTSLRFESEGVYANRHQIEPRYPLADIRLLEFMLQVPSNLLFAHNQNRAFFRNACKSILPAEIFKRSDKSVAVLAFYRMRNFFYFKDIQSYWIENMSGGISELLNSDKIIKNLSKSDTEVINNPELLGIFDAFKLSKYFNNK